MQKVNRINTSKKLDSLEIRKKQNKIFNDKKNSMHFKTTGYDGEGYKDPDSFKYNEYNEKYYAEYCSKLSKKIEKLKNDYPYLKGISFKCHELKDDVYDQHHMGIFMIIEKKERKVFQLKSDQFGFSVNANEDRYDKYPYYKYLFSFPKEKRNIRYENVFENVFGINGWINATRQVGGSFLWPIDEENDTQSFNPKYNQLSGIQSYLEDRVDLKLYEVKEVYEHYFSNRNDEYLKHNILAQNCIINHTESKMYKFLEMFGNFDTFIMAFGFDDNFAYKDNNEWKIINVYETEVDKLGSPIPVKFEKNEERKKVLNNCNDPNKFKKMFDCICTLVEKRRIKLGLARKE